MPPISQHIVVPALSARSTADCYSATERRWMLATQDWRGRWLDPLLRLLTRLRVSPDAVTGLSLVFGLAFCPLYGAHRAAALLMLLVHVLLDGLDGPLARHQRVASRRGSFTDTFADQTVVTAVALTLMAQGGCGALPGGLYVFLYALVVGFAMVRNALLVPYTWLVRPRFVVYAWLLVDAGLWPGTLNAVLWVCDALLAWKVMTGFVRIRGRL